MQEHESRILNATLADPTKRQGHRRENAQILDAETLHDDENSPTEANMNQNPTRPGLQTRESSKMNDRFPMIETGREQHLQVKAAERKYSSTSLKTTHDNTDKENQRSLNHQHHKSSRTRLNKQQSYQSLKSISLNEPRPLQRSPGTGNGSVGNSNVGNRLRTDFSPQPSPLRQNLQPQSSNRAKSIVDLRSQSYGNSIATSTTTPSPTSRHLRRKATAMAALNGGGGTAAFDGACDGPAASSPISPLSPGARMRATASARSRAGAGLGDDYSNGSPERNVSPLRRYGSVTPTGGQRMADVFLNSRRREQGSGSGTPNVESSPVFL